MTLDSEFLGAVSLTDHVATSLARLSWLGTRCLWCHVAWAKDEAASAPCLSLFFFFFGFVSVIVGSLAALRERHEPSHQP